VDPLRAEMNAIPTEKSVMPGNVDPLRAEMAVVATHRELELAEAEKWRLETLPGVLKITGLAAALGAAWWAARSTGLLAGLLAAAPTWRHVDPLPALGRDEQDPAKPGSPGGNPAKQNPAHRKP